MALTKQPLNISFGEGLDLKTDPFQVAPGKFLALQNSVFDKAGRLTKRNGYGPMTALPDTSSLYLTTFNGNLTAIGEKLQAYSTSSDSWIDKGTLLPIDLETLPMVRNSTNQSQADSAVAPNGAVCVCYTDQNPTSLATNIYKYVVVDSVTGQNLIAPTTLAGADPTYGTPRVFILGNYFVILYTTHPAAYHIQYIAISINNPTSVTAPADITTSYVPSTGVNFDGVVANDRLFIAYNTTGGGQSIHVTYLPPTLGIPVTPAVFSGAIATNFSLTADMTTPSNPIIYINFYNSGTQLGYTAAVNQSLNTILAPTAIISATPVLNLASTAQNGSVSIAYEVINAYGYDGSIPTHYIDVVGCTQSGTVSSTVTLVRSVGLASKAFLVNGSSYFVGIYNSPFQPSYFLFNQQGEVVAKLAYSNGPASYYNTGLPNVTVTDQTAQLTYLYKDLITAVNKTQGVANTAGIYSQTGINLASFDIGVSDVLSTEIGSNLNLTGGFLTMYDGVTPVEQGFFVWPDSVEASGTTGGSMSDQQYYYQVTYEWADNQGNVFRSAPSIPVGINLTSGQSAVTLNIPTLRLTYKVSVPVKIVIYRWSQAQQSYYQVTNLTAPILNDTSIDYVTYTDTLADASILGNALIYTTGGVLEDISPPATSNMCLFNNRLFLVDAEDRNLLWFSKQVIEATPVEMSDLLTLYIAPTTASQGSTGPITALAPMDDKLIIFKQNALGYINGIGPDNTGANSQYSDFVLINSVVGCTAQQSIVFMPQGLMFQSAKGIWLLGRDLSTTYIGAPVETLTTGATVQSAVNVPGQTQVRFTLDTGITLMYDYYFAQWGSFTDVPAVSSTIYQSLHTYINDLGQVFQETPGVYLDNTSPVLMSLTTSWITLAGIQGLERFYQMLLLGQYLTPFKLNVQLAYNYNASPSQATVITPTNVASTWGSDAFWGSGALWGGSSNVFSSRVFPVVQKCESFQVSITEIYDPSQGQAAGAGLTLSGMNLLVGVKKGTRTSKAANSFG